jgi:hypothetical protein
MSKLAYIAGLCYFPLIIAYMVFADGAMMWDKLYFVLEKALLCAALLGCIEKDLYLNRKRLFLSIIVLNCLFLAYIAIDWSEVFVMDRLAVGAASLIYIIVLLINFFSNDRAGKR